MNALMRGPGDFSPDDPDDRVAARVEELEREIADNAQRMVEIDREASEELDGSQYEAMFSALADADACGLIQKLAEGDSLTALQAKHQDVFARVARLARELVAERERKVTEEAQAQAERESHDWPQWRGTLHATQHHAQMRGLGAL